MVEGLDSWEEGSSFGVSVMSSLLVLGLVGIDFSDEAGHVMSRDVMLWIESCAIIDEVEGWFSSTHVISRCLPDGWCSIY
jgi:hypothetical protein